MSKEEIVDEIRKMGYRATINSEGIILIDEKSRYFPKFKKILKDLGYKGSFGLKSE